MDIDRIYNKLTDGISITKEERKFFNSWVTANKSKSKYEQYEQEVLAWIDGAELNLTLGGLIRVVHIDAARRLIDKGVIRAVHMNNHSGVTLYERI